jgi:hypothetical protein
MIGLMPAGGRKVSVAYVANIATNGERRRSITVTCLAGSMSHQARAAIHAPQRASDSRRRTGP